jgi:hypothetical protein
VDIIVCIAFAGGLGIGMLIQFFCDQRNKFAADGTPSASHNSAMPKCAACGKLLGIYVDGKPYHYDCADKLGPLTSA